MPDYNEVALRRLPLTFHENCNYYKNFYLAEFIDFYENHYENMPPYNTTYGMVVLQHSCVLFSWSEFTIVYF